MTDPNTPVIVGTGQTTRHPDPSAPASALAGAPEPIDLMVEAAHLAVADSGATGDPLRSLDSVWVPQPLSRRYPDPGALVLDRLGATGARSYRALVGGNSPQLMVNEAAAAIQRGEARVCLITGAESMYTRFRARAHGVELPWTRSDMPGCPNEVGDQRPGTSEMEDAHGAAIPIQIYPLFETAIRSARGRTVEEHQRAVGTLWSRFAAVAAANPHAWSRTAYTAEELVTPAPDNRVVTFPYTKRLCANLSVDQSAAVLLTNLETARALGVPDDRLVFPLAGADAHDHFFFTQRWSLAESPAIRQIGRDLTEAGGVGVDDIARFDLYSCFPSAVEIAMDALGMSAGDERPVSLTGGLTLFGGPGNNYVSHSIAEAVAACRRDPGSVSMVTALGWYVTKHSAGLYSTAPLATGFRRVDPASTQARVDALPRREPLVTYDGPATVEATSVPFSRDGTPERALVSALTPEGHRVLAVTTDPGTAAAMVAEAWEDRAVTVRAAPTSGDPNSLA